MQTGRGGMGSHKHGISGRAGKSPKFRHWMKREAEKLEQKRPKMTRWFERVSDLFKKDRP